MTIPFRGIRFFWLLGIVLLLGTSLGASWALNQPASGTGTSSAVEPSTNWIVVLGYGDVEDGVSYLHPVQAGRVEFRRAKEGDEVKKGDLLLSLDNSAQKLKLAEAEIGVQTAQKQLANAERDGVQEHKRKIEAQEATVNAARYKWEAAKADRDFQKAMNTPTAPIDTEKSKQPAAPAAIVVGVENNAKAAEEVVKQQEAILAGIKDKDPKELIDLARLSVKRVEALRDQAQLALKECDLYAPADGVVLRMFANPGDILGSQPRQPAVLFCPKAPRIIRADVLQEFAGAIKKGQIAYIEDDTRHGVQWTGKVSRVNDMFAPRRWILPEPFQYNNVQTLECIIDLDPSAQMPRIGQRVRVTIK